MTLRYGIIGAGMMGREHMQNLALVDGAAVTAIADPDESMRARAALFAGGAGGEVKLYADHKTMFAADACDAYIIASPNDTHRDILGDALGTSKPLLCEKPLCTTAADCRSILKQAAGRTAPVWVAMEYRYMPPLRRLLEAVAGGAVGTPRMVAIREHRYPFLDKVRQWNRFNRRTGGTLVEKCCHFWDLMRLVTGSDPVRVCASAGVDVNHLDESYGGHVPDIFDNAFVIVDFASGARGMVDLCMFAEGAAWQDVISVAGDAARADAWVPGPGRFSRDGGERAAQFTLSRRADKLVTTETVETDERILQAGDHHGATYFQHLRFRDLIRAGGGAPEVSLDDGLWSVLVGEAAEIAARSGRAVLLEGGELAVPE
ncbi:MAG: Gfo/Idh/MocA family oxidoreductase [Gammaproteobacteria bacterium]|nr:Gfo/Idh/MocA family oxidoreductase [Gammaproteobacteria bacterium]